MDSKEKHDSGQKWRCILQHYQGKKNLQKIQCFHGYRNLFLVYNTIIKYRISKILKTPTGSTRKRSQVQDKPTYTCINFFNKHDVIEHYKSILLQEGHQLLTHNRENSTMSPFLHQIPSQSCYTSRNKPA